MKRWLLVVTPALLIVAVGTVFIIVTDRDPEPLPPLSLASPSTTSVATPVTGPTGEVEDVGVTAPTGATGPTQTGERPSEEGSTSEEDEDGSKSEEDEEGSEPEPAPVEPSPDPGTVTLQVTAAKGSTDPQVFTVPLGATVKLEVTSTNVTDRVVVGEGAISANLKPGAHRTLTFSVDEPGEVMVSLESAKAVLARITVGS